MRKNPYAVLGVSENASDAEIREAYRALARKYQSGAYDGGNLESIAAQKMDEINEAYDTIIMLRGSNGARSSRTTYHDPTENRRQYNYGGGEYDDIRAKIRAGSLDDAETLLDGVAEGARSAEWYFLKGSIQNRRGWLEEASANYARACRMAPDNAEYKAAYNNLSRSGTGAYRTQRNANGRECSACDMCTGLLCADCCCECMGGDLIRCC